MHKSTNNGCIAQTVSMTIPSTSFPIPKCCSQPCEVLLLITPWTEEQTAIFVEREIEEPPLRMDGRSQEGRNACRDGGVSLRDPLADKGFVRTIINFANRFS